MWNKKHLLDIASLSREDIEFILKCAEILEPFSGRDNKLDICKGEILANIFFEPSTRTEKSFQSAMYTLGGDVITHKVSGSSQEKGESKSDTVRTMEQYSDILVIRDSEINSVKNYSDMVSVPVINAGDGSNEHPTQALLDLFTIKKETGRLNNLNVIFIGDLLYGRTVHSLIKALRIMGNNKFFGVSPKSLEMPDELKSSDYQEIDMNEIDKYNPDIIYATRIQKERMQPDEIKSFSYEIDRKTLDRLPKKTMLMHPLPRVNELNIEIEKDPRFIPFIQARCGLQTRMAILAIILGHEEKVLRLVRA